jgi:sugar/nucleoside kinase (ribokinase family)
VSVKPNFSECLEAVREDQKIAAALARWGPSEHLHFSAIPPEDAVAVLAKRLDRPIFCTYGDAGVYLASREAGALRVLRIPAYLVPGPIDIVGAGDSTSAGIACAVAAGATLEEAAAFGNLVASITIQQIGTTGTASPEQVRRRWQEVTSSG